MKPFQVVKDFEDALCEYTGAPYAVTTTSCTMALLLAVAYHLRHERMMRRQWADRSDINIPNRTYVGVPMSIIHAGGRPTFRGHAWKGAYQLSPHNIWDSARWLTSGLYAMTEGHGEQPFGRGAMVCVSFHWAKTLGIQQGGAILHDSQEADAWLRRARFDGRVEGVPPAKQETWELGWHAYMSPEVAAAGLVRLKNLPKHNAPLPWGPGTDSDYPDLSKVEVFK